VQQTIVNLARQTTMPSRPSSFKLPSLLALVALLILPSTGFSQVAEIDEYVSAEMSKSHIPGLAFAVVRDGKIVLAKGYGVASLELQTPVTPETIFQAGSIEKQFTARGVMLLVQSGKRDPPVTATADAGETGVAQTLLSVLVQLGTTERKEQDVGGLLRGVNRFRRCSLPRHRQKCLCHTIQP
jgi:hypothetical protein